MTVLRIYTTLGCHLCEQMEALVTMLARGGLGFEHIEIAEDEALMARYATRIPVLLDEQGREVLEGNVSPEAVANWLEARGLLDEAAWSELNARGSDRDGREAQAFEERTGRRMLGRRD
ncbi:glutaredoxin family protein [Halomonas cupida]|uniref:Glutaredoxin-like domain n=1 Tax=Halomonas cupida TaxID=44933 RepID=A0A1M6ZBB1_9GAMM|nr:glutaredoxin family protein [Halomonas cupida]GEN24434.1 hypothetical protein HCU01_23830 [Halomonas cupida]SHL27748.1 Glutaredoxin-like domain [Halomonas cupida]